MCTFGLSKRAHFTARRFKHHQNSTRRQTPRETEKNEMEAGEGKKREILGLPPFGAPPFGATPLPPPSPRPTVFDENGVG